MRIHGVVVISGANGGIGYQLTLALINNPNVTKVYAGCRNADKMDELRRSSDPHKKLRLIELDISKDWSIRAAVEAVEKDSGKVNVLINNAAILEQDHRSGIPGGDRVSWLKHFDINIVSHAMMIQEFLPLLNKSATDGESATIVNISGLKGSIEEGTDTSLVHGNIAYMCSKAALNKLTKTLSIEHPKILTISICPGWNKTNMGGPEGMKTPEETAPVLISTVNSMTLEHSGQFWNRKGERIPY